jgi:Mg-chelatase subunit ChlI
VITYVLGAPGSGKTAAVRPLASLLPDHVVLDWDAFMAPAAALAGRDITGHCRC